MTDEERARKANVRCVMSAIIEVSKSISELGVAETEILACDDPLNVYPATRVGVVVTRLHEVLGALNKVRESMDPEGNYGRKVKGNGGHVRQ